MEKEKILIIDDERDIVTILEKYLSKDYEVLSAFDGKSGLELMNKEKPAVVLLDYKLPDSDGLDILKQIINVNPETYVIFMTAYGSEEVIINAFRSGVVDYFAKPFDLETIGASIKKFLSKDTSDFRSGLRKKIKELEEINRELSSRNFLLRKLSLFSSEISGIFVFSELVNFILKKVKEIVQPDEVLMMLFDEKKEFLEPIVVEESADFLKRIEKSFKIRVEDFKIFYSAKENPVIRAIDEKKPQVVNNISFLFPSENLENNELFKNLEKNINEVYIFPIIASENFSLGVLIFVFFKDRQIFDSKIKFKLLMSFIDQAASAIERSIKFQKLLDESSGRLDTLYETSASLIFASDPEQLVVTIIEQISAVIKYDIFGIIFNFLEKDWLVIHLMTPQPDEVIEKFKEKLINNFEVMAERKIDTAKLFTVIKKGESSQFILKTKESKLNSFLTVPMVVLDKIFGLVSIASEKSEAFDNNDKKFFNAVVNQASMTIEGVLYEREKKYRAKLEKEKEKTSKELKMAQYVQKGLLPKVIPNLENFEVYAFNLPSEDVGGDFYHFIPIDNKRFAFVIGDVAGKGVPAALLMAMGNALFFEYGKEGAPASLVLANVDEAIKTQVGFTPPFYFYLTAFYGILNLKDGEFTFAKAGHNPPLYYNASTGEIKQLDVDGPILGIIDDAQFKESSQKLEPGDLVVFYTDGITEAKNKEEELFGLKKIEKFIKENAHLSAKEMVEKLVEKVKNFTSQTYLRDDLTIMILKRRN